MDSLLDLIRHYAGTGKVEVPGDACPRLHKLAGIKAVVFDVYGTLFSSSAGDISLVRSDNRDELMQSVLRNHGIVLLVDQSEGNFHRRFLEVIEKHQEKRRQEGIAFPEVDIRAVWKDYLALLESAASIKASPAVSIERLAVEFECRVNPVQTMPGLHRSLAFVSGSRRIMGIISNAQFYTPLLFRGLLGSDLPALGFSDDISVWSYRLLEGKPSPRLYQVSADRLQDGYGIEPQQVLYIGNDIRNDIWPAQKIGFRTALFAGDSLSLRRRLDDPRCKTVVPDLELTHLRQLADCLD